MQAPADPAHSGLPLAACSTMHPQLAPMPPQLEQLLSLRSCPHCGEGLELGPGVDLLTATCPHPRCGRPLHVEDAAAEQAFRRFSSQQKLRECPKCGAMVERVHGCNHMTCRRGGSCGLAQQRDGMACTCACRPAVRSILTGLDSTCICPAAGWMQQ